MDKSLTSIAMMFLMLAMLSLSLAGNSTHPGTIQAPADLPAHWAYTSNTGNNATIVLPTAANPNIDGAALANGDYVGVFTSAGLCCGYEQWQGANISITTWGDNDQTTEVDGIKHGEVVYYRVFRDSEQQEWTEVTVAYLQGDGTYSANGFMVLSQFDVQPAEAVPALAVTPAALDFGFDETELTLEIANTGGGDLTWTVAENPEAGWITEVNPASGTGDATVAVTVDRATLASGSHSAELLVSSNGGDQTVSVTIQSRLKGDVNDDGNRNILDILHIIAFINGTRTATPGEKFAADANSDDAIDVQDISQIIIWINESPLAKSVTEYLASAPAQVIVEPMSMNAENLKFKLVAPQSISGVQLRFKAKAPGLEMLQPAFKALPEGVAYSAHRNGDQFIVLLYSLSGKCFAAGEHTLFEMPVKAGRMTDQESCLEIEEAIVVDIAANKLPVQIQNAGLVSNAIPETYSLGQNYPNPFNPATRFTYHLAEESDVTIKVYNLMGQAIKTLVETHQAAGSYEFHWDGTDELDRAAGSGLYLCIMQAGNFRQARKMLLVR
ncbi:T9SS type A sorting domain-containing protein [candidate division KSB1 bacterium]|nr:T9SS type A sorting domain-containing protein [candidate division KSB1 bacterium]